MTNNFKDAIVNKKFYAENANAALLLYTLGQVQCLVKFPTDLDDGVWVSNEITKAEFMIIEFMTDDNVIINTDVDPAFALSSGSTGKVTMRVYPNILPFSCWDMIQWTNDGTVTCTIKKDMGVTTVSSNITNPKDLQSLNIGGEYVDFEFTLGSSDAKLKFIDLLFTGGE